MIRSVHMNCCLTAQIRFMHFKGPGSFKKNFKICENIDELKGHRLIPLTPPLFFHFTLPLKSHCTIGFGTIPVRKYKSFLFYVQKAL
jgi:hypothetical protein